MSHREPTSRNPDRSSPRGADEGDPASRPEQEEDGAAARSEARPAADEPDVLLDVPQLKVDEIGLEVEGLEARVSLDAGVGDLVRLAVGADVRLGKVKLDIKGVEARALLKVRLEKVLAILGRALATVDGNPEVLRGLARTVDDAADRAGDLAGRAMGDAVGSVGGAARRAAGGVGRAAQEAEGIIEAEAEVEATDAAKRKAEQLGVDLSAVRGTGAGGGSPPRTRKGRGRGATPPLRRSVGRAPTNYGRTSITTIVCTASPRRQRRRRPPVWRRGGGWGGRASASHD